jgi:hypothetical protein
VGGFQIDNQFEPSGLFDRQIGGVGPVSMNRYRPRLDRHGRFAARHAGEAGYWQPAALPLRNG